MTRSKNRQTAYAGTSSTGPYALTPTKARMIAIRDFIFEKRL